MTKIGLFVDSTCDLPIEQLEKRGIFYVPLHVIFGSEEYLDMVELSSESFFEKLVSSKYHPTTSLPSPKEVLTVFEKARDQGIDILYSLLVSSKLSGTFQSATIAKTMFDEKYGDMEIKLIDSQGATGQQGLSALTLNDIIARNGTVEEIDDAWEKIKERSILAAAIDTLRYLRRGGRVGTMKSLMSKILNLKPLITIKDGTIESFGKARGLVPAMDELIKYGQQFFSPDEPVRAFVGHSVRYDLLDDMREMVTSSFNVVEIDELMIGSAIGVHIGPGAIGYVIQPYLD
ncbi:MAG: DegV family protein [Candidatus Heimdallarchaeota archaeon]|nr:DegV family protein [Candidatus Heimdallarchaeota archaeon]MCK5049932.1 DegV family protein [Candidatus Heimdallarchaeota archaeon]